MAEPVHETPPPRGNWLLACGPGCAVLLLALVAAAVIGWRASMRSLEMKREEVRAETLAKFEALLQSADLPPDQMQMLEQARAESQRPEVGYFGLLLYLGGVIAPLADGHITGEDLSLAQETREYLRQSPAPAFWAYGDYVDQRPLLQAVIESLKVQHEGAVE